MTSKFISRALLVCLLVPVATLYSFSQREPDQLSAPPANARPQFTRVLPRAHANAGSANGASLAPSGISGIDSLVNFTGSYHTFGYDPNNNPQNTWYYDIVGNPPNNGGATVINAPIVPVVVQLLDTNGSIRVVNGTKLISSPARFVLPTVNSPVFKVYQYSSGPMKTQFTDAVQRAEFYHVMRPGWLTLLAASITDAQDLGASRFVPVQVECRQHLL